MRQLVNTIGHWSSGRLSRVLKSKDGAASDTLLRYRDIAASHHNALEALSAYLLTLEPTQLVTEEIDRTLRVQDLLDREIELIL